MKVRHLPSALRHYPGFVLRNGPRMLAHTFRGSTWKSALGLESEIEVFRRYKALRAAEREYVPESAVPESAHDMPGARRRRAPIPAHNRGTSAERDLLPR